MSRIQIPTVEQRFQSDQTFRNELRKLDLRDRVWEALVKAFRERSKVDGISQTDWALAAGKTPAQMCRILAKSRNLTLDSVAEAFSALDFIVQVSVDDARSSNQSNSVYSASLAPDWTQQCGRQAAGKIAPATTAHASSPPDFQFNAEPA